MLTVTQELASGHRKSRVPFTGVTTNPLEFIEEKYIPAGVVLKDPRNMTKAHIADFCDHIRERQDVYGMKQAFMFRQYDDGQGMRNAEYGRRADQEKAAERAAKQRERRAAQTKQKQNQKGKGRAIPAAVAGIMLLSSQTQGQAQAETSSLANIDPSLRPSRSDRLIVPSHGLPSPRSTPAEGEPDLVVGFPEMQILNGHGYASIQPINGPNQGPPMYRVPAAAQRILDDHQNSARATEGSAGNIICADQDDNLRPRNSMVAAAALELGTPPGLVQRRSERTRKTAGAPADARALRSSNISRKPTKRR